MTKATAAAIQMMTTLKIAIAAMAITVIAMRVMRPMGI